MFNSKVIWLLFFLTLMVGNQITILIIGHSFGYDFWFTIPNGKCKPAFNINVSKPLWWYIESPIWIKFNILFQILLGFAQIIIPKMFLIHECLRLISLHLKSVFEYWYTFMILFHFGVLALVASSRLQSQAYD